MWEDLLRPGLVLLSGDRQVLRSFHIELAQDTLARDPRTVLWCDGDHGFDPYHLAEANLARGHEADFGAERLLVKRCMTPFQWQTVLTKHIDAKLLDVEASMIVVAPFDRLHSTEELADWEQEDHVRHTLHHLRSTSRRHKLPILLSVDMGRWWRTHPTLATMAMETVDARWTITHAGAFRAVGDRVVTPKRVTLLDFLPHPYPLPVHPRG